MLLRLIKNNPYSTIALGCVLLLIGYLVFSEIPVNVLSYDILGYYLYLPASFKYHDLYLTNFEHLKEILTNYNTADGFYQAFKLENGNWVMKYPMGMAILYSPFYFIGDSIARFTSYPLDGFSLPYQLSVLYGCFIYTSISLYYLRKILLWFFNDIVTALVILIIVLGTNYLLHVSIHAQPAMVHNLLFMLHTITIYYSIKWYQQQKWKYSIIVALSVGLTAIARPPEFLIIMFVFFYGVYNKTSFKERLKLLWTEKNQLLFVVLIVVTIICFQLIYWKLITGAFVFDSYSGNLDEGFNFLSPYVLEFLFSFRKGWLLYTPIMIFSIIGFVFLYKNNKYLFLGVFIYFILNFYVMTSWSCWWYGTSFSSRAIIPAYTLLVLPLASFVFYIINKKIRFLFYSLFVGLIGLNIFQSWQASKGILHGSLISKAYYKSVFFQTTQPTEEQKKLLLIDKFTINQLINDVIPDLSKYKLVYTTIENFDQYNKDDCKVTDSVFTTKPFCFRSKTGQEFAANLRVKYNDITKKSYLLFKLSAQVLSHYNLDSLEGRLVINMQHNEKCYSFKFADTRYLHLKKDVWNKIYYYFITPDFWDKNDEVQAYFWNVSNKEIFVDDLILEAYEPIKDESVF